MRNIRLLAFLMIMGIALGGEQLSPKLTEVARGLIEYVNNTKQ